MDIDNNISLEKYEKIKLKYGSLSSWAIWSEQGEKTKSNMGDISFFENPTINFKYLKSKYYTCWFEYIKTYTKKFQ